MLSGETTDITLFVRTSTEEVTRWNRQRIIDALLRETDIDIKRAEEISKEVEKQILASGINLLTTSLIRELVDAKLIEKGLEHVRKRHARLGFPLYDVKELLILENRENANLPHSPEGTNLILAEGIKKEYALLDVFSPEVAESHVRGDLHLHSLGYIDRPLASCQSLEYLKKFGLNLPHAVTVAKPAKYAEVLLAHMVRFSSTLQGHFAGVISWDVVNFSFAPFLASMSEREIRQFAQMLVYEFSQLTAAKGGQTMFTDIHLYWDAPLHLKDVPALGPGGKETGKTYQEYEREARRLARALLEVFLEGDGRGMPFVFPRPVVHFTKMDDGPFLELLCETMGEKGNPCLSFDRGSFIRGACNNVEITGDTATPFWQRRTFALQNVSLNLPRLAYQAEGKDEKLWQLLDRLVALAVKAHREKRDFIERLLSYGEDGPLAMLTMKNDGRPYLTMPRAVYLIGIVGLNELCHIHRGYELKEAAGYTFGLKVIGYLQAQLQKFTERENMLFFLEQTPAETTAYRFARLDLKYFSPRSGSFIKGDIPGGGVYYTNSTHIPVTASLSPFEQARIEGLFHPLIRGNAVTNIWLGSLRPSLKELKDFLRRVFHATHCGQITLSPTFSICNSCGSLFRGIKTTCPHCLSDETDGFARITQYFSKTSGWNIGKLAELNDREKNRHPALFQEDIPN